MSSVTAKPLYLSAGPSAEGMPNDDVSATRLVVAIRRHLLAVLVIVILIPISTAVIILQVPSRYAATASVQVQTRSRDLHDVQAVSYDNTTDPSIVTTEVEVLRSTGLAMDVVKALHLDRNPDFVGPPQGFDRVLAWIGEQVAWLTGAQRVPPPAGAVAMRALLDVTTVANKDRSNLITITVATHLPALSVAVANAYAQQYLQFRRDLKASAVQQANAMLVNHMMEVKEREFAAEHAAELYREEHGLSAVAGAASGGAGAPTVVGQQLAELNRLLVNATTARVQAEANFRQARALIRSGNTDKLPEVLASPVIQRLREMEAELAGREAGVAAHVVRGSPLLDSLHAQVAAVRYRIKVEAQKVVASLSTDLSAAREREVALTQELQSLSGRLEAQDSAAVRLQQLEAEATSARAIYQDFLAQEKRTSSGADMQLPDAELIADAQVPLHATSPKRTLVVLGSLAVSLVIAALVALNLERHQIGFRSSEEFESELGLPVLGLLPKLRRRACRRFSSGKQPPRYREVLNAISARVWTHDPAGGGRVTMITSAIPTEAKTWLAMSLGESLSWSGARILLIDCDLRRGSVAAALGLRGPGLTDLPQVRHIQSALAQFDDGPRAAGSALEEDSLEPWSSGAGRLELDAARRAGIVRSVADNFDVIPVFPSTVNPAGFLAGRTLQNLIEEARREYDVILIDTPPIMMVADGLIVARQTDSVIFATRWGHTPRRVVARSVGMLNEVGACVLGGVLTMVNTRKYASGRLGGEAYVFRNYRGYYGVS